VHIPLQLISEIYILYNILSCLLFKDIAKILSLTG
jgi:hypothetical protein